MIYLLNIFVFTLGLCIGSFLNVVIYRTESGESIINGRSHCPYCGHILEWYDLIPLLSFILLRGKCRYCRHKISWQYPLVELLTGLIFFYIFFNFFALDIKSIVSTIFLFIISSFLIVVSVSDIKYYAISDKILYPAILTGFFYFLYNVFFIFKSQSFFLYSILSILLVSLFFFSLCFFSREKAMGFGDVEISLFLGFALGFPNILVCFFLSFIIGGLIGIILIMTKRKRLASRVPFAPFLASSAFITLFWGGKVIDIYFRFLQPFS